MVVCKRSTYTIGTVYPSHGLCQIEVVKLGTRLEIFYADCACGRVQVMYHKINKLAGNYIPRPGHRFFRGYVTGDWLLRPRPPQTMYLCTPGSGEP